MVHQGNNLFLLLLYDMFDTNANLMILHLLLRHIYFLSATLGDLLCYVKTYLCLDHKHGAQHPCPGQWEDAGGGREAPPQLHQESL